MSGFLRSLGRAALLLLAVIVVIAVIANLGSESDDSVGGAVASDVPDTSCESMTQSEIEAITTGNDPGSSTWTGSGDYTVSAAMKAPTTNKATFDMVGFLKVDAPGMDGEVFTFVVGGDFDNVTGLLVGADAVTREFWEWGAAATSGSPMAEAARDAVRGAPSCL